jgi:hypothetical protein
MNDNLVAGSFIQAALVDLASCVSRRERVLLIGVASKHFAPRRHVGSMAEPQPVPEQKKGKRHQGGLDCYAARPHRQQVNGDPGDEKSEDDGGLFGELRQREREPPAR